MIHEFFEGIPIVESLILILISFIGSIIHEYIFNHRSNFFKNPNVIITVVVSYLISFSIDPFIMQLSPRFILLPPLILGLLGIELATRLSTLKGSSSLLEYILGFLKIKRKGSKQEDYGVPTIEKENNEDKRKKNSKLKRECISVNKKIDKLLRTNYMPIDEFNSRYRRINYQICMITKSIDYEEEIPVDIAFLVSDVMNKAEKLDHRYNVINS